MDFSIIVPTYQERQFLADCLQSLLHQEYRREDFEVIVSDARSTDGTIDIAHQFADRTLVDDRKGIAYGRNVGARAAKGDVLIFVDADAQLAPDFLAQCRNVFSDSAIAGMTGIACASDGGILQRFVYHMTYLLVRIFSWFGVSLFPGICVAYRRKRFLEIGGFREDFGIVEDLDLSNRIARQGKCVVNKEARAFVSTRRLAQHLFSTVMFHIYCDVRYLVTGKAPRWYPKSDEIRSWHDLWHQAYQKTK